MNSGSPHVGVVCNSLKGGGAEGNAALLVRSWPEDAGSALLIAVSDHGDLPVSDLDGIEVWTLGIGRWPRPRATLRVVRRLRQEIFAHGLTHLITNSYGLNQTILLARRLQLIPRHVGVIVVEHLSLAGRLDRRLRGRWRRRGVARVLRWLYRAEAHLVAVSQGVASDNERLLRLPAGTFTVIPNGIDRGRLAVLRRTAADEAFARRFEHLPRPIVVGIGRLEAQKNFPLLIDAFLQALPYEGSLVILGEGGLRRAIESSLESRSAADRVHLPGRVSNPYWYLDRADLFVLSSDYEGYPIVLLEALACGTPIVATDCPWGPAEMLGRVPSARVVPVRDLQAMTRAIHEALPQAPADRIERVAWDSRDMAASYAKLIGSDVPRRHPA